MSADPLQALDQRVVSVAFRLNTANVGFCSAPKGSLGWTLHDLAQYGLRVRDAVARRDGLGAYPRVRALAPDGPAIAAGVVLGDEVIAINEHDLAQAMPDGPPSYQPMAATLATIDRAIAAGPVRLTLRRGGATYVVDVTPVAACPFDAEVLPSPALAAAADGRHITITSALAAFTAGDDELAVILGHELAHDILRHPEQLGLNGWTGRLVGSLGLNAPKVLATERQADHVGLYLAARAGFDVTVAPAFLSRLARQHGSATQPAFTHPAPAERMAAAAATVREIGALKAAGKPLVPEGLNPAP